MNRPENGSDRETASALNPLALSLVDAAELLSKAGAEQLTVAMLERDLKSGAPTNDDHTLNLVCYAAWLVKEEQHGQ